MDDNLHLLANPSYCKKRNIVNNTIDDKLLILLNKKFPHIKVTEEYYNQAILKIENIFVQIHNEQIIKEVVQEIIQYIINEQVLP